MSSTTTTIVGFMGSTGDAETEDAWESPKTPEGAISYHYTRSGLEETLKVTVPLRCEYSDASGPLKSKEIQGIPLYGSGLTMLGVISDAISTKSYAETKSIEVPFVECFGEKCKKFNECWGRLPKGVSQAIAEMGDCSFIDVGSLETTEDTQEEYVPLTYTFQRTLGLEVDRDWVVIHPEGQEVIV
ncbi:uncharacterized protein L199_007411 [Kwoniella botswanensis]|uniref:uncharacterized protein n=1 Tax=Kwoniella botswanensis TaxID=1268659 RepID=UPI00315CE152